MKSANKWPGSPLGTASLSCPSRRSGYCEAHTPRSQMTFIETELAGAFLIDLDRHEDVRGYFARVFCAEEFRAKGLNPQVAQCSISFNRCKGTLRGMHWQAAPKAEAKLIRC